MLTLALYKLPNWRIVALNPTDGRETGCLLANAYNKTSFNVSSIKTHALRVAGHEPLQPNAPLFRIAKVSCQGSPPRNRSPDVSSLLKENI